MLMQFQVGEVRSQNENVMRTAFGLFRRSSYGILAKDAAPRSIGGMITTTDYHTAINSMLSWQKTPPLLPQAV